MAMSSLTLRGLQNQELVLLQPWNTCERTQNTVFWWSKAKINCLCEMLSVILWIHIGERVHRCHTFLLAVAYLGILFGGGFNKFSCGQRADRTGIWGRWPSSQWFRSILLMSETRIVIRLLRMYFPRNWKFGSALSKLRNFGEEEGGLNLWTPPRYATA
jgi:hypothetical protein